MRIENAYLGCECLNCVGVGFLSGTTSTVGWSFQNSNYIYTFPITGYTATVEVLVEHSIARAVDQTLVTAIGPV